MKDDPTNLIPGDGRTQPERSETAANRFPGRPSLTAKRTIDPSEIVQTYREQAVAIQNALRPLRQLAIEAQRTLEPFRQQQEENRRVADQISENARVINAALDPIQQRMLETARLSQQVIRPSQDILSWIAQWVEELRPLEEEISVAFVKLAHCGWFLDPDLSFHQLSFRQMVELAKAVNAGDTKNVIRYVTDYYQDRIDEIEERICSRYPHRKPVLTDGFGAHREKKYHLSIPVFLAQADGIWRERFSTNFFLRSGRVVRDSENMDKIKHEIYKVFFDLFEGSAPLWQSERERESTFNELNRHQVLHGEVFDYGTEINSLKAISFLTCLSHILKD